MAIKSNNVKGNPYHNESDGKFTSKDSMTMSGGSFETLDDFLSSFEEEKPAVSNTYMDFKPVLNKVVTNKMQRNLIISTLDKQINLLPDNFKKVMLNFFEETRIPINIKGQDTAFHRVTDWLGNTHCDLLIRQKEIMTETNYNGHLLGTALVHETFHAIDWMQTNKSWMSVYKKLSNGKTLNETLRSDIGHLNGNFYNELLNEYNNEYNSKVDELSEGKMSSKRLNELFAIEKDNRDAREIELKFINKMHKSGFFASYTDYVQAFDKKVAEYKEKLSPYADELKLARDIDKRTKESIEHKYSVMSDICESIDPYNPFTKRVGYGHGYKYWNNPNHQVIEFFAECAEGEALNKDSLAKLEKYFPNAVNGFREIMKELEGGK